jgi:acyl-coenzyme A synthetase/AMP-(fatty) acid ligase
MWGGESLPTPTLHSLKAQVPHPKFVHILGSTETHIMAHYEIPPAIPADSTAPIPVGRVSERFRYRIIDESWHDVAAGSDGELCLSGAGVAEGYWKAPQATASAFSVGEDGRRWYRTGDLVRTLPDGNLLYRGRRDRMVKKRGNRIELGEVEACLCTNSGLREVAVLAIPDDELGVKVHAFVVSRNVAHPSIIELKAHCARFLPPYMVPDTFAFPDDLPRTSTGKIDYPKLTAMV